MTKIVVVAAAVLAELLGAVIFLGTRASRTRSVLSCLGLGFMVAIVFLDVLPDIEFYKAESLPLGLALGVAGVLVVWLISRGSARGKWGGFGATAGMGLHNFGEGVVIVGFGALSPMLALGFLLHKLPEGMVSFSLTEGFKERTRFIIAAIVALLIPLGALLSLPEEVEKPAMSFCVGVILFAVARSGARIVADNRAAKHSPWALALPAVVGGAIGAVSCFLA